MPSHSPDGSNRSDSQRRLLPVGSSLLLLFVLLCCDSRSGRGGCSRWDGGWGSGWNLGPDVTAPTTSLAPSSGLLDASRIATLSTNEAATVYFTTDESEPAVDGATTTAAPSPVELFVAGPGMSLRFFAIDTSGNREEPKSATLVVDDTVPMATLVSPDGQTRLALLQATSISFFASEACSYSIELGGDGEIGAGTAFVSGETEGGAVGPFAVSGMQFPPGAERTWLHLVDAAGNVGTTPIELSAEAPIELLQNGPVSNLVLASAGDRAFIAGADGLVVIDIEPLSPTRHTVLTTIPTSGIVEHLTVAPGGDVYGAVGTSIVAIDPVAGLEAGLWVTGAGAALDCAVTPDGSRVYFVTAEPALRVLDVDPLSPSFGSVQVIAAATGAIVGGGVTMHPNGRRLLLVWHERPYLGVSTLERVTVEMLDVDPASPTFHGSLTGSGPLAFAIGVGLGLPSSDFATDDDSVFLPLGAIRRVDLADRAFPVVGSSEPLSLDTVVTAGADLLIVQDTGHRMFAAIELPSLSLLASIEFGLASEFVHAVSADRSHLYTTRVPDGAPGDSSVRVWRLR